MLWHLLKKDILIIKKYIYIMMGLSILIPLFIVWRIPQFSTLGFVFSVSFTEFILCQYLFMKEHEYSKASALLCAAPYTRWMLVASKYLFLIMIYIYCVASYSILAAFIPLLEPLSMQLVLSILLVATVIYCLYLPIQYKIGYEKTKFILSLIIISVPYLSVFIIKMGVLTKLNYFSTISLPVQYIVLSILTILVLVISSLISIKIYSAKELL